jgi:L-alanine-DL-glutamate epimerase-like enolase superfamily enzyme
MSALSGIDIAMHDLVARTHDVPIWSLLGGKVRNCVPAYVSFVRRNADEFDFVGEIQKYLARGFRTIKLHTGTPRAGNDEPEDTVKTVRSLREVWPSRDDLDIIVDVNSTFTRHGAMRVGRQLEELDVRWFEEPIFPSDREGYRSIQNALDIPIATGEGEHLLGQFRELIVDAKIDIVQPNLLLCGGYTEGMKIAALAEAFNRPIACNNWCSNSDPTLMTAAQSHFWVSANMCFMPQEFREDQPSRGGGPIVTGGVVLRDGYAYPPTSPGLGVSLDEQRIFAEGRQLSA